MARLDSNPGLLCPYQPPPVFRIRQAYSCGAVIWIHRGSMFEWLGRYHKRHQYPPVADTSSARGRRGTKLSSNCRMLPGSTHVTTGFVHRRLPFGHSHPLVLDEIETNKSPHAHPRTATLTRSNCYSRCKWITGVKGKCKLRAKPLHASHSSRIVHLTLQRSLKSG